MPKPFLPLVSEETLFEQAIRRVAGDDRFAAPMVVAGAAHGDLIAAQLGNAPGARLVVEPCARNTAPAIALAAALLPEDAVMLVCPSDHHIADSAAFRAAALAAAELAQADYLVSFGIAPDRPETGYGYLERGEPLAGGYRTHSAMRQSRLTKPMALAVIWARGASICVARTLNQLFG